jgi:hypothetical protein
LFYIAAKRRRHHLPDAGGSQMFDLDSLAGNWAELSARLARSHALARWSRDEPALASLTDVARLVRVTRRGCDPTRGDEILGALIRRAAAAGGADDDALLLVLHLLSDMVVALATDLADLSHDVLPIIVNELACQIRSRDVDQPVRGWAVTLKWATRRAVLAEFRPGLRRNHPEAGERAVDATDLECWVRPRIGGATPTPTPGGDEDLDVVDVLLWAVRDGVAAEDISLLAATEAARAARRRRADAAVAAEFRVSVATLYRRNSRTLAALRRCGADYLAAVA